MNSENLFSSGSQQPRRSRSRRFRVSIGGPLSFSASSSHRIRGTVQALCPGKYSEIE